MKNPITHPHLPHIDWRRMPGRIFMPFLLLSALFLLIWVMQWHLKLADLFFTLEGGHWALKKHWLTQWLLHDMVKHLHTLLVAGFVLWASQHRWQNPASPLNRANAFLFLSLLASYVIVGNIKHSLHMDCPWDLQRYGGIYKYVDFTDFRPPGMKKGQCFPAGHASLGYSWLALYFYCLVIRPALAKSAMIMALLSGLVLGGVQQLRGAHFILDDIATLAICWLASGLLFLWFYHPRQALPEQAAVVVHGDK